MDIGYLKILILLSNTFPVFKINNGKLPNVLGLNTVTSIILTISQQFMRDQKVSYSTLYYFLVQSKFSLHSVLAVDDRHVAFCEYNGSVVRIICVAVATLANEKLLERASDNDLLLCRKSTSNKTCYRQ